MCEDCIFTVTSKEGGWENLMASCSYRSFQDDRRCLETHAACFTWRHRCSVFISGVPQRWQRKVTEPRAPLPSQVTSKRDQP